MGQNWSRHYCVSGGKPRWRKSSEGPETLISWPHLLRIATVRVTAIPAPAVRGPTGGHEGGASADGDGAAAAVLVRPQTAR